ncbi:epoxide hydrolase 4 [Lingula anatina]|uniref:Epoxide hydrolase 4 n=1 Tax=Lingula anatina TaxID=7574 RepID=A0A1S3HRG0_LINAN|nr:epoxide hydrolase 4 [Lingula anatina]|eukprot:XP_013388618.1 epoxide hydrolase 4 [Lingula anatina]
MGVVTAVKVFLGFAVVYTIASFWSVVIVLPILLKGFMSSPIRFFQRRRREIKPACLNDPSLGTHTYVRLQGLRMHCVVNGKEGKPLMLFVHGFPEGWYSWRHQLREFGQDYRCVAIDMRGYGETDKPPNVSDYTMDKLTGDIKQLIPALGYESCVLVSHDWGGVIAWAFAEKYPDMVDKLITMNAPHRKAFADIMNHNKKQLFMSWYIFFFQLPWFPEFLISHNDYDILQKSFRGADGKVIGSMTPEDLEAYTYCFSQPNTLTSAINYYRASMRTSIWQQAQPREGKREGSGKITVPVLTIWGDADKALHKDLPELARKYNTDYTLKYIHGCSHWTQQERPDVVNEMMKEFLKRKKLE